MKLYLKIFLQKFFSALPNGEKLNYQLQKKITKTLPISDSDFIKKTETAQSHLENYKKYSSSDTLPKNYYEFGAGYDLVIPITMSLLGVSNIRCIDVRELAFPDLLNDTIKRFQKFKKDLNFNFSIPAEIPEFTYENFTSVLKDYFDIEYIAPLDARDTRIADSSIDFIVSNATMEHIPKEVLDGIMKECYRILKPDGIMSNVIDYRDHGSYFDDSVSVYNFLQYSERKWNFLNPSIMFQNRMRHSEYAKIINKYNYKILLGNTSLPTESEKEHLSKMKLDEYFTTNFSMDDIAIQGCIFVLSK